MNTFEQAWTMSNTYYRVCSTVRVTVQRRAVNTYTFIEDLIADGDVKRWKIRRGSVRGHGVPAYESLLRAKARAEAIWHAETGAERYERLEASP